MTYLDDDLGAYAGPEDDELSHPRIRTARTTMTTPTTRRTRRPRTRTSSTTPTRTSPPSRSSTTTSWRTWGTDVEEFVVIFGLGFIAGMLLFLRDILADWDMSRQAT